ncbi:MAG: TIGR00730 family Rossman fold protein [Candidatus Hydrogenedentes bacterium]|nr:TIGR00730 family Rossman fold protein [Candidatus Hydrogenedentota bacterium]
MNGSVCVYCSSSDAVPEVYFEAARSFGAALAQSGRALVYGGGKIGLMGVLARAVHEHGGKVIGVIPEALREMELAYTGADELIITADLRERKAAMESRACAFVALPGGYGTLEEMIEVLTLKQLHFHAKPIVMINTAGFYQPLLSMFEQLYEQRFAKPETRQLYHVAGNAEDALTYINHYTPASTPQKWY